MRDIAGPTDLKVFKEACKRCTNALFNEATKMEGGLCMQDSVFETAIKTLRITLRRDCRAMIKNDTESGKGPEPEEKVQPKMDNIGNSTDGEDGPSGSPEQHHPNGKKYKHKGDPNQTKPPKPDAADGKDGKASDKEQHAKTQQNQANEANQVIVAQQYQDKVKQIEEDRRQQEHWLKNMGKQGKGELIRDTMAAGGPSAVATAQAAAQKAKGGGKEEKGGGNATKKAGNATKNATKNATNATNATEKNATKAEDDQKESKPEKVTVNRERVDNLVKKNTSAPHVIVKPEGDEAFDYQKQKKTQDKGHDEEEDDS